MLPAGFFFFLVGLALECRLEKGHIKEINVLQVYCKGCILGSDALCQGSQIFIHIMKTVSSWGVQKYERISKLRNINIPISPSIYFMHIYINCSNVIPEPPLQRQYTERTEPWSAHHHQRTGQRVSSQVNNWLTVTYTPPLPSPDK